MRLRTTVILSIISLLLVTACNAQSGPKSYSVAEVIELGVVSGPGATSTYLSPDGNSYAHFSGDSVCIYSLPENEEEACYELNEDFRVQLESVRWSPDGRYIAFPDTDALRILEDADIQMLDLENGEIRNITDDGSDARFGIGENEGDTVNVDIGLAWSEKNQLAVLRYTIETGESRPDGTTVAIINPQSGDLEASYTIPADRPFLHLSIAWHGNNIALGRDPGSSDEDLKGIDIMDVESGEIEQMITPGEDIVRIHGLQFSPDGNYLMVYDPSFRSRFGGFDSDIPDGFAIIDLETNEETLIDADHFVTGASFSPDGNAIAYTVFNHPENMDGGLYIASAPGEVGEQVLSDLDLDGTTSISQANLTWASNNTILVRNNEDFTAMLIILEVSN